MSAGQFKPPQFHAVIAYDPAVVSQKTLNRASHVCSINEFSSVERAIETTEDMSALLQRARTTVDLVVYVGDMPVRAIDPVCHTIECDIDTHVPGVVNLVREILMEAGHVRSIFEQLLAGWVGRALVITLPTNAGAVTEALIEILPAYAELLDPMPQPPKPRLTATDTADSIGGSDSEDTATILRMPLRKRD